MRLGILRDEGDVRSPQYDRYTATAEVICQLIRLFRGAGDDCHPNQLGAQVEIDIFNTFIDDLHFHIEFRRNIGRKGSERERSITQVLFEDASTMTIERTFGRNQNKFHDAKHPSLASQSQSIVSGVLVFSDWISGNIIFQNRLFIPNTSILDSFLTMPI